MNRTSPPIPQARGRWRKTLGVLLAGTACAVAAVAWLSHTPAQPPSPAPVADAATIAHGAYLARVGNCAGCHTARGGQPYAGGRGLATPFGTVVAGNLTPDPDTGLGRWSADDFWQALHHGRARGGRLLAPAFPFTEFTHVSRADSDALYVFLRSLPPVVRPATASTLRFPFNTQAALAVWRALSFRPAPADAVAAAPGRSAEWQRGAYLVRGLGHCAACHAPRNALGATQQAEALAGGMLPMQPWHAPSLAPLAGAPPAHQRQALLDLLRTGQSAHGVASGPMAEVVVGSTQHWSATDLQAAVTYLLSLPPQRARTPAADRADDGRMARGAALYADQCASCHGSQGEGAPGIYPPLAGNPSVTLADPGNALQVIRHGGFAPATQAQPRPFGMPPAGLDPQELADVLSYIRQAWGHRAPAVSVIDTLRAP